jgi:hypothetical protein
MDILYILSALGPVLYAGGIVLGAIAALVLLSAWGDCAVDGEGHA